MDQVSADHRVRGQESETTPKYCRGFESRRFRRVPGQLRSDRRQLESSRSPRRPQVSVRLGCLSSTGVNTPGTMFRIGRLGSPRDTQKTNSRLENPAGQGFSSLLTTRGNSEMRSSPTDVSAGGSRCRRGLRDHPGKAPLDFQPAAPKPPRHRARPSQRRTSAGVETGRGSSARGQDSSQVCCNGHCNVHDLKQIQFLETTWSKWIAPAPVSGHIGR